MSSLFLSVSSIIIPWCEWYVTLCVSGIFRGVSGIFRGVGGIFPSLSGTSVV